MRSTRGEASLPVCVVDYATPLTSAMAHTEFRGGTYRMDHRLCRVCCRYDAGHQQKARRIVDGWQTNLSSGPVTSALQFVVGVFNM